MQSLFEHSRVSERAALWACKQGSSTGREGLGCDNLVRRGRRFPAPPVVPSSEVSLPQHQQRNLKSGAGWRRDLRTRSPTVAAGAGLETHRVQSQVAARSLVLDLLCQGGCHRFARLPLLRGIFRMRLFCGRRETPRLLPLEGVSMSWHVGPRPRAILATACPVVP